MATHQHIFQARRKFELAVAEALGLPLQSTSAITVDDFGFASFLWVGMGDPPEPPNGGWYGITATHDGPLLYVVEKASLADGVWDIIHQARREWVDSIFAAHGITTKPPEATR